MFPPLLVQSYLRSGKTLEQLKLGHGVKSFVQNSKISLSYDQIEARESDLLSQQCRGLILREGTFDIIAAPMFRFFNLEQTGIVASIDWATAVFEEKMDGSLIIVYFDDQFDKWMCATRARPEADVPVDCGTNTFSDLVNIAIRSMLGFNDLNQWLFSCIGTNYREMTFCFELCSPANRIVCEYKSFMLTLLSVRDKQTLVEHVPAMYASRLRVPVVKAYAFDNLADLIDVVRQWDPKEHEGVVIKDANFNRVKVKNPAYTAYNHMRDSLSASVRGCMEVVLLGKEDDVIPMVPEFIGDRIKKLKPIVAQVMRQTQRDFDELSNVSDMKEFALLAQQKIWPAALFALKRGKATDLISFVQGNKKEQSKLPVGAVDTMLALCAKIDPNIKNI